MTPAVRSILTDYHDARADARRGALDRLAALSHEARGGASAEFLIYCEPYDPDEERRVLAVREHLRGLGTSALRPPSTVTIDGTTTETETDRGERWSDGGTMDEQKREARLRRMASRQGNRLRKDRPRSWNLDHHGGYMIVDSGRNAIVAGQRYEMTQPLPSLSPSSS